ncbi:MAG: iduronate-2-sulfatase, partial [Planctomycetaceae bacterium]|nr:iduronate-2-sulfatase [Planctomycetaceae bacterium]
MKSLRCFLLLFCCLSSSYSVSSAEEATAIKKQPNVLLICIDDLRPELRSFGAEYIHSPNIDALAATGRAFHHHFVQAPTCGASRYTLLTGQYGPAGNGALFQRA